MFVLALQRRELSLAAAATTNNRYPFAASILFTLPGPFSLRLRVLPPLSSLSLSLSLSSLCTSVRFYIPVACNFYPPTSRFSTRNSPNSEKLSFRGGIFFSNVPQNRHANFCHLFSAFSRLENLVFGYNQATLSPLSFVYELEKGGQILFVLFSLNGISSF